MTTFRNALNYSKTENGARTLASSGSLALDLFSKIGSARSLDLSREFSSLLTQEEDIAVRMLLWLRDVRGGAGERAQFRRLVTVLEAYSKPLARRVMRRVVDLGRFDDLTAFKALRLEAVSLFASAINARNGLACKWAPRIVSKASAITPASRAKREFAMDLCKALKVSPCEYRKLIVRGSRTVETQMSARRWNLIDFESVPSLAAARYQAAFAKHEPDRYASYRAALQRGQSKINASSIYPYDILKAARTGDEAVATQQFRALPDWINGKSVLPMVDTSASMSGVELAKSVTAMDVAISLGIYCAERSSPEFKNIAISFTSDARILELKGGLLDKERELREGYGYSTNIERALRRLVSFAVDNEVSPERMPSTLLIISDMQFDASYIEGKSVRALESAKTLFRQAGYAFPSIVFWNLASRESAVGVAASESESGVALVSGFSPSILKAVLGGDVKRITPSSVMRDTLFVERYDY